MEQSTTPSSLLRPKTTRPVRLSLLNAARALSMVVLAIAAPVMVSAQTLKLLYTINEYAGNGTAGTAGVPGKALNAELSLPAGLSFDQQGNVYIGGDNNHQIYKVDNLGNITVVAGTGTACATTTGACGDGGLATAAQVSSPYAVALDPAGNIFFTDQNRIREVVAATGIINTIVGTGTAGYYASTTPVAGTSINIQNPDGLAVDANDNVYISDSAHSVVYKYAVNGANAGKVYTYVNATATQGFTGDGGQSTAAEINNNIGLAIDAAGNLYIADQQNNRVRRVTTAGVISTIAGTGAAGYTGDGGTAGNATLNGPRSIAVDVAGDVIVSDSQNLVIRIIYATGGLATTGSYIETLAGTGAACAGGTNACGDGGLAIDATFFNNGAGNGGTTQFGFDLARGAFYISDLGDNRVRSLVLSTTLPTTPVGTASNGTVGIQVVAGSLTIQSISITSGPNGTAEFTAGTPTSQTTGSQTAPCTLGATSTSGTICNIPVSFNPAYPGLRRAQLTIVTSAGTFTYGVSGKGIAPLATLKNGAVTTFAGTGVAGNTSTGVATTSQVSGPRGSAVDGQGNLFFTDTVNNLVRKVTPAGVISTVAGGGTATCTGATNGIGDGCVATQSVLNAPEGVAIDSSGNIYIADTGNNVIREISNVTNGTITTIAGGGTGGTASGILATTATLSKPTDLGFDSLGNLYIADTGNNLVKSINTSSIYIFNYVGGGATCAATAACGDGGQAAAATLNAPSGIGVDPQDNVLIADTGNNRIRLVTKNTGVITTVVGTGTAGYADNTTATTATLNGPTRITADPGGDYYIGDTGNNAVRQVVAGQISTFAGNGTACAASPACGDAGAANLANLSAPRGVALDGPGNLYIADTADSEIRKVTVGAASLTFATTAIDNTSSDSPRTAYLQNIGNAALTLSQPATGTNASISTGYSQGTTQGCPQLTNATGTLAAGTQCAYSISFTPTTAGTSNGTLIESDNSLNAASTQTITLRGYATEDNPSITINSTPNPSTFGQTVTLSSTVSGNGTTPTGTVTYYSVPANATTIYNLPATAAGNSQQIALPAGTYELSLPGTAGGGTYDGWNPAANPTTNNRWTDRFGVTLCATCTQQQIVDGQGTNGGEPAFASAAAAIAGYEAAPQYTDTAFNGSGGGTSEVGNPYIFTLTAAQTITLFVPDTPGSFGDDSGGLSLALTSLNNLTPVAQGTLTNGATSVTTTTLPVGTTNLVAVYGGDQNHVTAISVIDPQVVNKAGGVNTDTLTTTNANPAFGTPVTLTDTIPELNGVCPTGPATFQYTVAGGNPIVLSSTAPITQGTGATCVATLTTSALPVGTDVVQATYPTDANYAASSSNTVTETVGKFSNGPTNPSTGGSNVLTTTNAAPAFGTPVTLKDTIAETGGACPTSLATFSYTVTGSTTAVTIGNPVAYTQGTGATCVATVTTSALPTGTDTVTAVYPADANYTASTSNALTETVGLFANGPTNPSTGGSNVLTTTNAAPAFGTPVTLKDTITETGGACPTSLATFSYTVTGSTTAVTIGNPVAYTQGTGATCVATVTTSALPVGTDTVTAGYPADANYAASTSNPLAETVGKFANGPTNPSTGGSNVLTTTNAAPAFGTPVTLKDTITETGGVCPTSLATFSYTVTGSTTAVTIGNPVAYTQGTGATCVATVTTSALPTGTDTVTAGYPADANYAASTSNALTETVGLFANGPTNPSTGGSNVLTTTNAAPAFGTPVTLKDTITETGGACPTSLATFSYTVTGSTTAVTIGNPVAYTQGTGATCVATVTTSALPTGTDTVTAGYPADANYAASTSNALTETVGLFANGPTNPSTGGSNVLTTTNAAPAFGTPVTLKDTITETGGACPTSLATFSYTVTGSTTAVTIGNPVAYTQGTGATCVATVTTSALPTGTDTVTAGYPADANYAASTSNALTETVGLFANGPTNPSAGGSNVLTTSNATPTFGSPVTLKDTITETGGACPTSLATFSYTVTGSTTAVTIGNPVAYTQGTGATCVATVTTSTLPTGTDTVTAGYPADTNYAASTSNALAETVGQFSNGPTNPSTGGSNVLTTSNAAPAFGSSVTLKDTIAETGGSCPTSLATFSYTVTGSTTPVVIGAPVAYTQGTGATCVATVSTTALPYGQDVVTASYPADTNYSASSSNSVTETVGVASPTGTLSANPATGDVYGNSVTLTETITPVNGVCPTGIVTFTDGTTALGTGTINPLPSTGTPTSCTATVTTTNIPAGSTTITATYPGGGAFGPVTSTLPYTVALGGGPLTDTLTSSNLNPNFGQSVTLTDTIPELNGVCPVGPATFTSNGVNLTTTAPITQSTGAFCVATYTTAALPTGSDTVQATFPADSNYAASTSNKLIENVGVSGTVGTLAANPATGDTLGSPVVLTETINPVNGVCPTGTVTFTDGTVALGTGTITAVPATGTPTSCVATTTTTAIPSGSTTITATYPGNGNFGGLVSTLPYTVGPAASTGDTLVATPNTNVPFGTSVNLVFTVPLVNGVVPTGTVTFKNGTTVLGTAPVTAAGTATLATTALPVGTDTVTAVYPGDANYATGSPTATVQVVPATTAATLAANPATGDTLGSPVVLTETINPVNGVCPTGTVTFTDGTVALGTGTIAAVPATGTPTSCVATTTTTAIPSGSTTITATYPGAGGFQPITSTLPYTVGPAASTGDTLVATPNTNVPFGTSVNLVFTVPLVNGVVPTGTVTFKNGTTVLGTAPVTAAGTATLATTALPVGTDTVTAVYPGDANYATGSPTATVQVVPATTAATLAANPATGDTLGSPVVLTETINPVNGVCPTGTVTFTDGTVALGTGTITAVPATGTPTSCVATTTTTAIPSGSTTITATYPGAGGFQPITSTLPYTVGPAASTGDTLVATPNTNVPFGTSVNLVFTVPLVNGVVPTGTVTFKNGTTVLGTAPVTAAGTATLATTALPVGTDTVTAVYPGDANYATGSPTATVQVVPATTAATLAANPATGDTLGSPVVLTETINPVNGVCPTGTVTFTDGTVALGTGTIAAVPATGTPTSCVATTTTTAIPSGSTTITATYPGAGGFQPITSTLPYTVGPAASTGDTLVATPNTNVPFGTSVNLVFTVPLVNGVVPTGTVTFKNGTTVLGTAPVTAAGTATLATTALPVGTDTVTAVYPGDANYATGSPTATVQVVPATTAATLAANPATGDTLGSPVVLTETINPVNGVCPTGTVTFTDGTVALGTGTITAVPATGTPTSCVATTTTTAIPSGSTTITATYPGAGGFQPITSTLPYTVGPAASTGDTLVATPNTNVPFGTSVNLVFTVPLVNGVVPTGTVTFKNGTTVLGTAPVTAAGTATLATTALPVGTDTVTAVYPGDANYATGSPTATVQVVPAAVAPVLTVSNPNPTYGQPETITETIPQVNGVCPIGPVTFSSNGVIIGTGVVMTSAPQTTPPTCVATLTTTNLPAGTDTLVGNLPPDTNYTGGNSNSVPVTVAPVSTPGTIVINPNPVQVGQPVTITETIIPVNGTCPIGTVTFTNGTVTLGTGTITAVTVNGALTCIATTTVTSLPTGTTTITGNYPGGGNFGPIKAGPTAIAIADFTIVGLTTNTINPGDTTTFPINLGGATGPFNSTVTLSVTAGLPPGAVATFSPASLVPGAGPTLTTLTITTLATQAKLETLHGLRDISYGLLLLPLLGFRKVRRKLRTLPKGVLYPVVLLLMLGGVGSLTGCAGGYFGEKPHQYVITVTGTSGTLQHSTTVTLIVE